MQVVISYFFLFKIYYQTLGGCPAGKQYKLHNFQNWLITQYVSEEVIMGRGRAHIT